MKISREKFIKDIVDTMKAMKLGEIIDFRLTDYRDAKVEVSVAVLKKGVYSIGYKHNATTFVTVSKEKKPKDVADYFLNVIYKNITTFH